MKPRPPAFSLVEVVMALGIMSFAVVAILGLMSSGLQSSQRSSNDLALGLMTQAVVSSLRSQGFQTVATNVSYQNNTADNFFFNYDGIIAMGSGGQPATAKAADSYYACSLTLCPPASASTNVQLLRMTFSWPVSADTAHRQTRVILSSMVNDE